MGTVLMFLKRENRPHVHHVQEGVFCHFIEL